MPMSGVAADYPAPSLTPSPSSLSSSYFLRCLGSVTHKLPGPSMQSKLIRIHFRAGPLHSTLGLVGTEQPQQSGADVVLLLNCLEVSSDFKKKTTKLLSFVITVTWLCWLAGKHVQSCRGPIHGWCHPTQKLEDQSPSVGPHGCCAYGRDNPIWQALPVINNSVSKINFTQYVIFKT